MFYKECQCRFEYAFQQTKSGDFLSNLAIMVLRRFMVHSSGGGVVLPHRRRARQQKRRRDGFLTERAASSIPSSFSFDFASSAVDQLGHLRRQRRRHQLQPQSRIRPLYQSRFIRSSQRTLLLATQRQRHSTRHHVRTRGLGNQGRAWNRS